MSDSFNLPWVVSLIERLRPDLCQLFPEVEGSRGIGFLNWLITSGQQEYLALRDDPEFRALLQTIDTQSGLPFLAALIYAARTDVQALYPLENGNKAFLTWFEQYGIPEHALTELMHPIENDDVLKKPADFGVNLIGYVYGQLGIGEDLRMAARSLLAADVPMSIIDFAPGSDVPQNDFSMKSYVTSKGEYAFNIFCMTAMEQGRYYAERSCHQLKGHYSIGYWPWELGQWPADWQDLTGLVDEVWVSTQHTFNSLAPVCSKPVQVMPMAVELGPISDWGSRLKTREHFGLPLNAKLFCFAFDLKSYVDRKNPQACVDAFLQAFPEGEFSTDEVGLVIKVHKPSAPDLAWERLKNQAIQDERIHIIELTLSRPDLLALYQACDCFLSLHRAEGFGRGLAEALQLGLHVITTGYSGNVDFCKPPFADLVNYRLIAIEPGQYPYSEGQVWADPDVKHTAELMRAFVTKASSRIVKKFWPEFSAPVIGRRYKARLEYIYQQLVNQH